MGPPDLWHQKREFQFAFVRQTGLQPAHRFLDLGCGCLRGGIPIIAYLERGHYTGIDVRPEAIGEARKELAEAGLVDQQPSLICCRDVSDLDLPEAFDYVWAFSVLIHLRDQVLDGALDFVARHLAPHGVFFANVNLGEPADHRWREFPLVWRPYAFYEDAFQRHGMRVADVGALKDYGHVTRHQDASLAAAQRMLRAIAAR